MADLTPVASTALQLAAIRACESLRDDRLFNDPFARKLAGEDAIAIATKKVAEHEDQGRPFGQVRTRYFDDFLLGNVDNFSQVVLLGAGLDTRAFRLDLLKDLKFFEIDRSEIIDYKNNILGGETPQCDRITIATNLEESTWVNLLLEKGFDRNQKTMWILEGFLYYLQESQVVDLMKQISDLSSLGSYLGCDLINKVVANGEEEWSHHMQLAYSGFVGGIHFTLYLIAIKQ